MQFRADKKFQLKAFLLSLIFLFIQFRSIEGSLLRAFLIIFQEGTWHMVFIPLFFVLAITILHEGIHTLFYLISGAKIKLGMLGINPYIIDKTRKQFNIINFSLIILSPLVIISLLSLLFNPLLGSMIFYFNLFSSTGDILLAVSLASYPADAKFIDESSGYSVVE